MSYHYVKRRRKQHLTLDTLCLAFVLYRLLFFCCHLLSVLKLWMCKSKAGNVYTICVVEKWLLRKTDAKPRCDGKIKRDEENDGKECHHKKRRNMIERKSFIWYTFNGFAVWGIEYTRYTRYTKFTIHKKVISSSLPKCYTICVCTMNVQVITLWEAALYYLTWMEWIWMARTRAREREKTDNNRSKKTSFLYGQYVCRLNAIVVDWSTW